MSDLGLQAAYAPTTKACRCGRRLRPDNLSGSCKSCWVRVRLEDTDIRRHINDLYIVNRAKRCATPEGRMKFVLERARLRARARGLLFSITIADILPLPTTCPVLGIALAYSGAGITNYHTASLDRIDLSRGYVRGNVRVISWRANALRKDGTPQELYAIAMDAKRLADAASCTS